MRTTLASARSFSGVGLHTGRSCRASLHPAPTGHGVRINGVRAVVEAVTDARLGTTLGEVMVVEHLLAALYALGVDDVAVEVEGGEVPLLDGSAAPWTGIELTQHAGECEPLRPTSVVEVRGGDAWVRVEPAERLELDVSVDFPGVGPQRFVTDAPRSCLDARTFGWASGVDELRATGRALGATLDNVLVIDAVPPPRWRHADELARHKCLDLLGDLALLGRPIIARITASQAGHALHHAVVRATTDAFRKEAL